MLCFRGRCQGGRCRTVGVGWQHLDLVRRFSRRLGSGCLRVCLEGVSSSPSDLQPRLGQNFFESQLGSSASVSSIPSVVYLSVVAMARGVSA